VGPIIACFAPRSARIVVLDTVFVVPVRGTMGVFVIISCGLFSSPTPVPAPVPTAVFPSLDPSHLAFFDSDSGSMASFYIIKHFRKNIIFATCKH